MAQSKPKTQSKPEPQSKPMPPNNPKPQSGKQARRELARKKAKRDRLITIIVIVAVVLATATLITYTVIQNSMAEVFTDGEQTVRLRPDGRFRATLIHDNKYSGTYTKVDEIGVITITFSYGKDTAEAFLVYDQLYLPEEWDDGHGHDSNMLTRK